MSALQPSDKSHQQKVSEQVLPNKSHQPITKQKVCPLIHIMHEEVLIPSNTQLGHPKFPLPWYSVLIRPESRWPFLQAAQARSMSSKLDHDN